MRGAHRDTAVPAIEIGLWFDVGLLEAADASDILCDLGGPGGRVMIGYRKPDLEFGRRAA
jgi:hypothetical protein